MISAIILTKNEEKNIVDCLETLSFCEEIIVIDDNSGDRTAEVTKNLKNKKISIFTHYLNNDFSFQRNFGLSKAKGDWVLFVDADERVSDELKNEIIDVTTQNDRRGKLNGYFIRRRDFIWGMELKHGETGNIKLLRLAKRGAGRWERKVHEKWKVKGEIGQLKNPLMHYPHRSIDEFLQEINFYTDIRAKELYDQNVHTSWFAIVAYPLGKFLLNYLVKKGFVDKTQGLIIAIIMSFHSFLVRGKLWFMNSKNE